MNSRRRPTAHPQRRRRRHRGFTMLEMLVVGLVGVIIISLIANAWRWFGRSMTNLQSSAELTREMKLATDSIALDYGKAIASRWTASDTLQFDIDGPSADGVAQWESPDLVVEYVRQGEKLLRRDLGADTEISVADHVTAIDAATVDGKLQVSLILGRRNEREAITLQLDGP
jgi:type II secretory pathway pseudopilin PulG